LPLALVNRLQNFIAPDYPVFALYLLHAIAVPLQGFFNAIVYGFNTQLRLEYLTCFGTLAPRQFEAIGC